MRLKWLQTLLCGLVLLTVAQVVYRVWSSKSAWLSLPTRQVSSGFEDTFVHTEEQISSILDMRALYDVRHNISIDYSARNSVFLLKTHKTGSSTLQNILFRYGLLRNLEFALPQKDFGSFYWPIPFEKHFVTRQRAKQFHILCHHMIFNRDELRDVMPPNAYYVTLLRHPVDVFESAYEYFQLQRLCFGVSFEKFYMSPSHKWLRKNKCNILRMPTRNFIATDFGLPLSQMDNETAIYELIRHINQTFQLVLINDDFELSLVVLKKSLNWSLSDVVSFPQNVRDRVKRSETSTDAKLLEEIIKYNKADMMIYEHFLSYFRQKVLARFDERELVEERSALRELTASWYNKCVEGTALAKHMTDKNFAPYGYRTRGYVLREDMRSDIMCRMLTLPELPFTKVLKHRTIAANKYTRLLYIPP